MAKRLDCGEGDPHPGIGLGVDHLAEGREACAAVGNPQRDLRPLRQWASGVHVASKQAQVRGACREEPIRPHVGQFNAGRERITACAVESRTNGTTPSLLWILCQAATRPNNTRQIKGSNRFSFEGRLDSKRYMGIELAVED